MGVIKEIIDVAKSLGKGLKVTVKYWFSPSSTITVQYPEEKRALSERTRGILFNDVVKCTACSACVLACPVKCISLVPVGKGKARKPKSFVITISQCMFCGLCVDACPTKSLQHTQELTMARYGLEDLQIEYVTPEMAERFVREAEEYERTQAEKAKKEAEKSARKPEEKGEGDQGGSQ